MQVPMLDLRAQYAAIKDEINAAVIAVMEAQQFRGGPVLEAFETALAAYAGVDHAIGVGSGSDALFLALKTLNLQPGDEVITTTFSFFATGGAIVNAGGVPVFVDIEPDTFNINPAAIEAHITSRTRAIVPVHIFGQCAPMSAIQRIAERHDLRIIEDAAQALGARHGGRSPGAWGDAAVLSFYPTKNLGAAGEGGAVLTNDDAVANHIRLLRCHGASQLYEHVIIGVNSHLHTVQAAVLQVKLPHLDAWNSARQERARYYTEHLSALPGLVPPVEGPENQHVYHQYVIRLDDRDRVRQLLADRGIGSGVFYPAPLHRQPCFASYLTADNACPVADQACREVLALPLYPELTRDRQTYVIEALHAILSK